MAKIERLARITGLPASRLRGGLWPLAWLASCTAEPFPSPRLWIRRLRHPLCDWDEAVTRAAFRADFGREIDLETPRTFNEKVNWLKLYDRRPVATVISDKVAVRDFVRERGHGDLLQEVHGIWDRPEDVPVETLPETFVLKPAHGCNMFWMRRPGDPLEPEAIRREMRRWVRTDFSLQCGEWQYRAVPRRIIAEALLPLENGQPHEYKLFCFGGVPRFVRYVEGRFDAAGKRLLYLDPDWRKLPFKLRGDPDFDGVPPRPPQLDRMLEAAAALSADEPFVRVDFNLAEGRLRFSELTLHPQGGSLKFDPAEWDRRFGDWIALPRATVAPGRRPVSHALTG